MTDPSTSETPADQRPVGPRPAIDVVFTFTWESWDDAVRREMMRPPDRLVSFLMETPRVSGLLVANPPRSALTTLVRSAAGRSEPFPSAPRRRLTTPLRLRRTDPISRGPIEATYQRYDRALQRAAARTGLADPHVVSCHPLIAGFAPFGWAQDVTYFGRDDWLGFDARARYWPAIRQAYRSISRSGTKVVAVSSEIIDRIDPSGPSLVVPNGVEPAEWLGEPDSPPEWFTSIPGPRISYVGTLDERLDVPGLLTLAAARRDVSLVLFGPVGNEAAISPLRDAPNVHLRPHVGRRELASVLRASDACGLFHVRNRLTEAMSPLKVYEYLAAGCPVIATDLAPVRGLSDRVVLCDEVGDFAEVIDHVLALGPQPEDCRERFVVDHSWQRGHERILDFVCA